MKIYFYRGFTIMKNTFDNSSKWIVFENDTVKGNTLDQIKNNIDKHVGGHPTGRIPKRMRGEY